MKNGIYCTALTFLLVAAVFLLPIINSGSPTQSGSDNNGGQSSYKIIDHQQEESSSLPTIPKSDEIVTFIVRIEGSSLLESVLSQPEKYATVRELAASRECRQYTDYLKKAQAVVKASILRIIPEAGFEGCFTYNTVINGFSVTAPYSSREKLQKISGVESVTLASRQSAVISAQAQTTSTSPAVSESSDSDAIPAEQKSVPGEGCLIAVIDSGFDCFSRAFTQSPETAPYSVDDIRSLTEVLPFNLIDQAEPYKSGKILYAYDYAGRDMNVYNAYSDHGTKVAAAAAGSDPETPGAAPGSCLALMKVCPDGSGETSDDVLLAALDDAAKLAPTVINLSLGVPRISSTAALFEDVYELLSRSGIQLVASAGNHSENLKDINPEGLVSRYTDYSTIAFPSSDPHVLSVASADSPSRMTEYLTIGEKQLPFTAIVSDDPDAPVFSAGQEYSYRYLNGYGEPGDFGEEDLTGQVVILNQGKLTFEEKLSNAAEAGAAGVLVLTEDALYYSFYAKNLIIPGAVISQQHRQSFRSAPKGNFRVGTEKASFAVNTAGKPSVFTSYGVTADLRLKPDIMAYGTDVQTPEGALSGTSAAAASIAGTLAVLRDKIAQTYPQLNAGAVSRALLMNTAVPAKYNDSLYYTPRLQGAGLANPDLAAGATAYVTCGDGCAANMGDNEEGSYLFDITLHSLSDEPTVYELGGILQTDQLSSTAGVFYNRLLPESLSGSGTIRFYYNEKPINTVVLEPMAELTLTVRVELQDDALLAYHYMAPNGFYVDGYLFLTPPEHSGTALCMPLMGYCGSWDGAQLFDRTVYDADQEEAVGSGCLTATAAIGSAYPEQPLGSNITTGEYDENNIVIGRDTIKNDYGTPSAGVSFILPNFYLLRDAADYTITITDAADKTLYTQNIGSVSSYIGGMSPYELLLGSMNTDGLKNLFATLSEGDYRYTVTASAISAADSDASIHRVSYPFTVDNTPPTHPESRVYVENGRLYLSLKAEDANGIQGFLLYSVYESNGKYRYADRLSDLIRGNYISADAYQLISIRKSGNSQEYIYDITQLQHQLTRLGARTSDAMTEKPDPYKIYFRAADQAYNLSEPALCDTVAKGTVRCTFKDQDGLPVRGVTMSLGEHQVVSDKNGQAVWKDILPDLYLLQIKEMPEGSSCSLPPQLVRIDLQHQQLSFTPSVTRTAEAQTAAQELEQAELAAAKARQQEKKAKPVVINEDFDSPLFSACFGSIVLLLSLGAFLLGKQRRKV